MVAHSDVPEFQAMVLGWHEGFQGSDEPLVSRASEYLVWSWINELLTSNSEAEILFGFEFLGRYFRHLSSEVPGSHHDAAETARQDGCLQRPRRIF